MSDDSSSDEYHEDSLPDLVLSSAVLGEDGGRYTPDSPLYRQFLQSAATSLAPDLLVSGIDEITDIETEYFNSGDQARTTFKLFFVDFKWTDQRLGR